KGGVAERDDAGVTHDEVERQHKQASDGDLIEQRIPIRKQQPRSRNRAPESRFAPAPAGGGGEPPQRGVKRGGLCDALRRCRPPPHLVRANKPFGGERSVSSMTT